MRRWPLNSARRLGRTTRLWRGFPIVYILIAFFLVPLLVLGISFMFEENSKGLTVLGSFIVVILGLGLIYMVYYCMCKGGKEKCAVCLKTREKRRVTMKELPEDMVYLKAKMSALIEHTGLPEDAGMEEIEAAMIEKNAAASDDTASDEVAEVVTDADVAGEMQSEASA